MPSTHLFLRLLFFAPALLLAGCAQMAPPAPGGTQAEVLQRWGAHTRSLVRALRTHRPT